MTKALSDLWRVNRSNDPATAINEIKSDGLQLLRMLLSTRQEKEIIELRWKNEKSATTGNRVIEIDALPIADKDSPYDGEDVDVIVGDIMTEASLEDYSYEAPSEELALVREFQEQLVSQRELEKELPGTREYHKRRREFYNPPEIGEKFVSEFEKEFEAENPINFKSWARFFGATELNFRSHGIDPLTKVSNTDLQDKIKKIKSLLEDSEKLPTPQERKTVGREILSLLMKWSEETGGQPQCNSQAGGGGGEDGVEQKVPSQGKDRILQGEDKGGDQQLDQDTVDQAGNQPGAETTTEEGDKEERLKNLGAGGGGEFSLHYPRNGHKIDGSALAGDLNRIFNVKDRKRSRYFHGTEEGKISSRRLYRAPFKETIFKRREILSVPDAFVLMLIDGSGSMSGEPFQRVAKIADGFRIAFSSRQGYRLACYSYSGGNTSSMSRIFDETAPEPVWYMQGGGTPSGAALEFSKEVIKILAHKAKDKIIVHFTDGYPNDITHANSVINELALMQIKVLTITTERANLSAYDKDATLSIYVPSFEEAGEYLREKLPRIIQ
jgi:uncharacterized protein YegL